MASIESEVRAFLDSRSAAIGEKDLEKLLSFYSPDVVYFDIVPPLHYVGSEALRGRFREWFDGFEGPIGQELHEVTISGDGDTAIASMLIRATGTRKGGSELELWVRATSGCRRSEGTWTIVHEHVSVPVDLATRTALVDLAP